ncbi:hypothetical protein T3H97_06440 [Paenibacillus sp. LX16]|uniref:hypothetical protein n=1 Tax=Paenibacillus sp. LX16 TaxID=1740264 RepID=UPI002E28C83C|nr:hypothetical protein [Paenibacillus sp. LX16]
MEKAKYVVTVDKGYWSQTDAYTMKDVHAIVAGAIRDAKEMGRSSVKFTIEIK